MAPLPRHGGKNFYAALGVAEDADEAAIKKAYRSLVLQWHPDKHPRDKRSEAEEKIRSINAAYEILSNPTKRETYDLQRCAVDKRRRGVVPTAPRVSPRMAVPKEFMMQPIGYPESFLRCAGSKRMLVHTRSDASTVSFEAFFRDAKFSLWWLPEVNNMCRIRSHGSKAKGDKKAVAAGLAGGLNISFAVNGEGSEGGSEVSLSVANKGQKNDKVNFVAKESPLYEGAFRFETACRRGSYLAYVPPTGLRIVPFLDEDVVRVMDFMLVDFSTQFKFVDLKDVMLLATSGRQASADSASTSGPPAKKAKISAKAKARATTAVAAPASYDWISMSKLKEDEGVKSYFKKVLQKSVWETEDFIDFFKGHWTLWEYRESDTSVRLRRPEEKLGHTLLCANETRAIAHALACAGDEVSRISVAAAAHALQALADAPLYEEEEDISATPELSATDDATLERAEAAADLAAARKIMLGAVVDICGVADIAVVHKELTLDQLIATAERVLSLGGKRPGYDAMVQRKEAARRFCDMAVRGLLPAEAPTLSPDEATAGDETSAASSSAYTAPKDEELRRLLRLPGIVDHASVLSPFCESLVKRVEPNKLADVLRDIAKANSSELLEEAASWVLARLDTIDADESAVALQALVETVETKLQTIAQAFRLRAPALGASALAQTLISFAAKSDATVDVSALKEAARCLAGKAPLTKLTADQLLSLAKAGVDAKKSAWLEPVLDPVVNASLDSIESWESGEVVKLLLAIARAKGAVQDDARLALLSKAAAVMDISKLSDNDLVKLILAVSSSASSSSSSTGNASSSDLKDSKQPVFAILELGASQVAARAARLGPSRELVLTTQGLVQGLTSDLPRGFKALACVLASWPPLLGPDSKKPLSGNMASSGTDTAGSTLPADQLVRLAQAAAAVAAAASASSQATAVLEAGLAKAAAESVQEAAGAELLRLSKLGLIPEVGRLGLLEHLQTGACFGNVSLREELRGWLGGSSMAAKKRSADDGARARAPKKKRKKR